MPRKNKPTPEESPPPRKRKWRRRLLITSAVLLVLGGLANGPGARWLIHRTIIKELAKLDLNGELQVEGRITSGFSLSNGSFTSATTQAEVRFESLAIDYNIFELLDRKVRRLEGKDISITLVQTEKEEPVEEEEGGITLPDLTAIAEKLRAYRDLARPITIDFEAVSFRIIRPEQDDLAFQLDALTHPADADVFRLTGFSSTALGEEGLPEQDIVLRWEEDDFSLNELTLLPDVKLGMTRANYAPGSPVELFAELTAASSRLVTYLDSTGTVELDLTNEEFDLATTLGRLGMNLPISGRITRLHLHADNLLDPPSEWTLDSNFAAEDLYWQERKVGSFSSIVELNDEANLTFQSTDGLALTVITDNPLRREGEIDLATFWKDTGGTASLEVPSIHGLLRTVFTILDRPLPKLATIPDGAATLDASFVTNGPLQVQVPKASWSLNKASLGGRPLPDLKGSAQLEKTTASASITLADPREGEEVSVSGSFNSTDKSYTGDLLANLPDPGWILPFLPAEGWKPAEGLHLTWEGSGSLSDATHSGEAEIFDLTVRNSAEATPVKATLKGSYDWPKSVQLPALALRSGDLLVDGSLGWQDKRLSIPVLRLHDADGPLASIKGGLPLSPEDRSLEEILARRGPLDLTITADELELARLRSLVRLPEDLNAILTANLQLGGSLQSPTLGGKLSGTSIRLPSPDTLPLLATELELSTEQQTLTVSGSVSEPAGPILTLGGALPLELEAWRTNPEALRELPLDVTAKIDKLALGRLQIVAPALAKAEGMLDATLRLTGTTKTPLFGGGATVNIARFPLGDNPYRNIRDASLKLKLDGRRIIVEKPSTALIAGGKLSLSGSVDLTDEQPQLDLRLGADHALLWRNDSFILRSDGDLTLTGPFDRARLAGSLSLVECLYYKDIEIIPIGVPTTSAPKPSLPSFETAPRDQTIPLPAPFSNWGLDLTVRTKDPILIRGNVATGRITADTRIQGTLSKPRPSGRFLIEKATADLPFSTLNIKDGTLTLRPDAPLNPFIDIRGTSNVNGNRVNLNLYGSLNDPKYNLASDRGLAESEILTLLATGSTAADLEDPELAKSKAFQLFIDDLRRRANKPGGNKLFRSVLNELDDVNLKVGENDPFSGRKFNSATLQIEDRWYLSASVDGLGNTRGLVIFSMRFK